MMIYKTKQAFLKMLFTTGAVYIECGGDSVGILRNVFFLSQSTTKDRFSFKLQYCDSCWASTNKKGKTDFYVRKDHKYVAVV